MYPKSNTSLLPAVAPIVLSTFGKLASVRTPSPPTAGPHEKGPALKSMKAHLLQNMNECKWKEVYVFAYALQDKLNLSFPIHVSVRHSACNPP